MKKIQLEKKVKYSLKQGSLRNKLKEERSKQKIYNAVVKTLYNRRSSSFSLDEIALKIGSTKGLIYYYFKSKGDLLYKLNNYFFDFIKESVDPYVINTKLNSREKLLSIIKSYILTSCEHWKLSSVLWNDFALGLVTSGQARAVTRRRRQYINYISALINDTMQEENIDQVDPKVTALMIFGMISYISTWYKKNGRLSPEEIANHALKLISQGILENLSCKYNI